MQRRDVLLASLCLPLGAQAAAEGPGLAAAWDAPHASQVGVLRCERHGWRVAAAIDVPTRAHGVIVEPEGSLVAVARRPGDWLLRWHRSGRAITRHWNDESRRFNGHARRRGAWLYTTETDVATEQGLVVVRDARTLDVQSIWPSHGTDPHDLRFGPDGALWVANGGVSTRPETGRAKRDLAQMDSSLVRLDAGDGRLLAQWRLADPRLSLRHLAWRGGELGIALQAEHDDAAARARAPVLALFDGQRLRVAEASQALAGYGGDVIAASAGYLVGVPRAHGVARFGIDGRFEGLHALKDACALASDQGEVFAGGGATVLTLAGDARDDIRGTRLRLDNHWQAL